MPKLIDYPRTSYTGAWELCEVVDDTGGKCTIETAARKLDRKVSGSFKAIIGSAVKFNLLTSKRELLSTTTLFKRIKHAYDKQEELLFHREAFLSPPLFTQICRKFRSRELPVQMLDVMLIREFSVEEINAQGVAKAFVDGCRMVGLLDEQDIMADIDTANSRQLPRRELSNPPASVNTFRTETKVVDTSTEMADNPLILFSTQQNTIRKNTALANFTSNELDTTEEKRLNNISKNYPQSTDAIATLFGLDNSTNLPPLPPSQAKSGIDEHITVTPQSTLLEPEVQKSFVNPIPYVLTTGYQIQVSGPGVNTTLSITGEEDIAIASALLEKIRRQIKNQ